MHYLYLLVMSYGYRFIQVFEFSVLYIAYPFLTIQWQVMWLEMSQVYWQYQSFCICLLFKDGFSSKGNILNSFKELLN